MQKGASRPGGRPLNCPHTAAPRPIIHRRRHRPEYVDGYTLRGWELGKAMGLAAAGTALLCAIWWFAGI